MEKNETCPHEDAQQLSDGSYAAPIGTCRCCGFMFVYIAMSSSTGGKGGSERESHNPDPTLCVACGGKTRHEHWINGERVEYEPGSHVS